ncbi:MAG: ParB-like nuclease domain-containing protein [Bacteroidetes bacterium]|uniref:ParB-like nuclease domain-containing protein n=1 Tax=Candidatus Gallipaludibacter merdavium TaxID=2840839 RepID=A0A9D9N4F9_9BACT|nr:ParB-like nuclease domain-containing protein [Candidatus Gallipaludibacter merdavium]
METENRWKYEQVDIQLIDEAELNANEMSGEDFAALCDNIGRSGLSSVPCCYKKQDGRFVMISGHHRLRACKKLRYKHIGILYCNEEELTKDEIIAIQLSHNSLHGQDNRNILKKLFEQIQTVEFKKFAHINIDEISPVDTNGIDISVMKDTFVFSIILYPNSFDALDALLGDIREQSKKSDIVLLADQEPHEEILLKLQKEIGDQFNIKSPSICFAKLLELAKERLTEIQN